MAIVKEQEERAHYLVDAISLQIQTSAEQVEALRGIDGYKGAIRGLLDSAEQYGEYLILNSIYNEFQQITASFQKEFLQKLRLVKQAGGKVRVLIYADEVEIARDPKLAG